MFCLGIITHNSVARSVRPPINIWYLDDTTIGGLVECFCEDLRWIIAMLSDIGLEIIPSKSGVSHVSCNDNQCVVTAIQIVLPRDSATPVSLLKCSPIRRPSSFFVSIQRGSIPPTRRNERSHLKIRMEVASSRPDHLPAAKTSELSMLVKLPFWWRGSRCRQ